MPIRKVFCSKYFVLSIFAFIFSLIYPLQNTNYSLAQTQTPLEKAQTDYNFQFTKYRDTQEEYTSAKAAYESFKTATSKNNAYVKTRDYLTQVNKLYISYVAMVQENGNAINFTNHGDDKNTINDILKNETVYLNANVQKISQTKTLEELPPIAQELKIHLTENFAPKLNKVFAVYEVVETEAALDEFTSLSRILDRLVVFKLRAGETRSILNNWSSEIQDIRTKTDEGIKKAREILSKTPPGQISDSELQNISEEAKEAKVELKRSGPLFEEVARII